MPATLWSLHIFSYLTVQKFYAIGTMSIVSVSEMRKLKPRKVKSLVQGYTVNKRKSPDSTL